jgi:tetratricopeptide (TPR) repeat protein
MLAGEDVDGIARGREALEMAEELGLDEIRAHALNNIGVCRYNLGDDGGLADLEKSIAIARSINSPEVLRGYTNIIACLDDGGVMEISRVRREAMSIAERFGARGHLRWLQGGLSWELYALGEWDEALRVADEFVQQAEHSPHYLEGANRIVRAVIRFARGDDAEPLHDTELALAQGRTAKDPQAIYPALTVRAKVLAEMGELAAADRLAAEVFADLAPRIAGMPVDAGATLAELAVAIGREDELHEALDEAETPRRRAAEVAMAMLDGDFLAAAELVAATGHRALEARIRLLAAERLAAEGQRTVADAQLLPALDFFRSVAAARYVRKAESLLRDSA